MLARSRATLLALVVSIPSAAQAQTWVETETLFPETLGPLDQFGRAISTWGHTAVIGAAGASTEGFGVVPGKAFVYERSGQGWAQVEELRPQTSFPGDLFGWSISLHQDTLLVGSSNGCPTTPLPGRAWIFVRDPATGSWSEQAELTASPGSGCDFFGKAVALWGDTAVVAAEGQREVYVFERDLGGAGVWGQAAVLVASDGGALFGTTVALWEDTLAVGDVGADLPGVSNVGAVYVFERTGSTWAEVAKTFAQDPVKSDNFGAVLSLWEDTLAAGVPLHLHEATLSGAVYLMERDQGGPQAWGHVAELIPSAAEWGDQFGCSLSVFGDALLVGAYSDDNASGSTAGTVYTYQRQDGSWNPTGNLVEATAKANHAFGSRLALSGDTSLVCSPSYYQGVVAKNAEGLAFDPGSGSIYAYAEYPGLLLRVDPATGLATEIGPVNSPRIESLAFDPFTGSLYACDIQTDQLLVIDVDTAQATPVGPLAFDQVRGLAFDPGNRLLYGLDVSTDQLVAIDPATAVATAIGPVGYNAVRSLSFDAATGILYGVQRATGDQLLELDTATGASTLIGPLGTSQLTALTFDSLAGRLRGVEDETLYELDASSGAAAPLGTFKGLTSGAVHAFERPPASYCTAGTSSAGCQAKLSGVGHASATAPSGFTMSAAQVQGSGPGLYYVGTGGRQAVPWGSGTSYQCVVPPVQRLGLLVPSGTPGSCDGGFAQDLNALWCPACPKPGKNPGAGATVQAQLWYRDASSTSNQTTSLSDALEFVVGP